MRDLIESHNTTSVRGACSIPCQPRDRVHPLRVLVTVTVTVAAIYASPHVVLSDTVVEPGWDVFNVSGTFLGVPFESMPLGRYDFGDAVGARRVGNASMIIERTEAGSVDEAGQVDSLGITVSALLMKTAQLANFGHGLDFYFAVPSESVPSMGTMDVAFDSMDGGTYTANITLLVDLHQGSPDGAMANRATEPFQWDIAFETSPWTRTPEPNAVLISGANRYLKGPQDSSRDFWPTPQSRQLAIAVATVPEPSAPGILAIMALTILGIVRPLGSRHFGSRRAVAPTNQASG